MFAWACTWPAKAPRAQPLHGHPGLTEARPGSGDDGTTGSSPLSLAEAGSWQLEPAQRLEVVGQPRWFVVGPVRLVWPCREQGSRLGELGGQHRLGCVSMRCRELQDAVGVVVQVVQSQWWLHSPVSVPPQPGFGFEAVVGQQFPTLVGDEVDLSLIHISEPTRLGMIS